MMAVNEPGSMARVTLLTATTGRGPPSPNTFVRFWAPHAGAGVGGAMLTSVPSSNLELAISNYRRPADGTSSWRTLFAVAFPDRSAAPPEPLSGYCPEPAMRHPDIIEGIFDGPRQSIIRPRMTSTTTRSLEESRDAGLRCSPRTLNPLRQDVFQIKMREPANDQSTSTDL